MNLKNSICLLCLAGEYPFVTHLIYTVNTLLLTQNRQDQTATYREHSAIHLIYENILLYRSKCFEYKLQQLSRGRRFREIPLSIESTYT